MKSRWVDIHPAFADMGQVEMMVSWAARCMEVLSLEGGVREMWAPTGLVASKSALK